MGYGVVEERSGRLVHVAHGVIRADTSAPLAERLNALFCELRQVASVFRPSAVAVEGVFTCKSPRSALILGHARGIALLVAAQNALPVHEYPPASVKRSIGAGGAAQKEGVLRLVQAFLRLEAIERSDAADALAVAICHLNRHRLPGAVGMAKPARASSGKKGFGALAERLTPSYRSF